MTVNFEKLEEVNKNLKEIMASQNIYCPICEEKQFAPFDKVFTKLHDMCISCCPEDILEEAGDPVFQLIAQSP